MPEPTQTANPLGDDPKDRSIGRRILVVDDSDPVRDVIRTFLENTGFQVCGDAADGAEAIAKAKELKPNLIVLDLSMPGMSGVETAAELGRLMPEVPIVVLTMYGDVLGQSMAAGMGVKAVVAKADGMIKLIECVKRLLPVPPERGLQRGAGR